LYAVAWDPTLGPDKQWIPAGMGRRQAREDLGKVYNCPKIGSFISRKIVRLENPPKVLTKAEVNGTIEV
jgi:hypothetical protein